MNYNLITYSFYLPIIFFITIRIGWLFYNYGEVFLLNIFKNNPELARSINILLLIGYYLVNLGYAVITISFWEKVDSLLISINTISFALGKIIIILTILHYNNVFWLTLITQNKSLKQ
ncbi:MAG: hypothetical protein QM499_09000 [Flavobacteriaceae bacterium]